MNREKQYELINLVEKCFDFQRWDFRRSYLSSPAIHFPFVIYDSEWCRVKFVHYGSDYPGQPWTEMHIYYGRLHAENDESLMIWNDEICWCWHSIEEYALNFIDGLSPEEAVEKKHAPRIMDEFRNSEVGKSVHGPEWVARRHMVVWKHYGRRLFKLFDLRCPDVWEQYRSFLRKAAQIEDENDKKRDFPPIKLAGHVEIYEVC
ncbi:MAG: hypothetical protein JW730_21135 [Anaerolineales bacterium]|nr:hypothetical protein [Anaerolineales bacterium]